MKLLCTTKDLSEALSAASRVTGRTTLPILSHLLLKSVESGLEVTGYDLEVGIRTTIPAQVTEPGSFTASARTLSDLVNALPDAHVEFEADSAGSVAITCERTTANLLGLPSDEFPDLPEVSEESTTTIKSGILRTMLQQTLPATSADEARAVMTGVNIILDKEANRVTMVSTDGHRLAVRHMPCDNLAFSGTAIVPARALNELLRSLPSGDDVDVVIRIERNQAQFVVNRTTIVSRLIEGKFPDYESVIPAQSSITITAQAQELSRALRRVAVFARDANYRIAFDAENERMKITAEAGGVGKACEEVEIILEGEPIKIAFNEKYFADAINVIDSDGVRIELTGALNPGLIRPSDESEFIYVVMPMQIA